MPTKYKNKSVLAPKLEEEMLFSQEITIGVKFIEKRTPIRRKIISHYFKHNEITKAQLMKLLPDDGKFFLSSLIVE